MNRWRTIMYIFEAFSLTLVYYDLRAAVSAFHKKTFVLHSSGTCIQWAKKWKVMNKSNHISKRLKKIVENFSSFSSCLICDPLITLFSHFNSMWRVKAFLEAGQLVLESKPALLNSYLEERLCQKEFIPVIKY